MTLLSIENLSLSIRGTPILRDVSLSVGHGEILGVIGESGSGKSLTAFSVLQLLPSGASCEGRINLLGEDVLAKSESALCAMRGRDVGMVFQEPMTALNPVQTIGAQVAETILIHEPDTSKVDAMKRAAHALTRCELPQDKFPLSRYPHEMSGGQRQRVVIAMAIALQPKLLIADEPTTALDVTTQAEILDLLARLVREDDMGLMLISHDLAVVTDMAHRIAIMKNGAVVEEGGADLHRTMSHPYTKALFKASSHQPDRNVTPQDTPLLQVQSATRDYTLPRKSLFGQADKFRAVDNVSFQIKRGESLGLVGESGCGKSTLTRAILGLEPLQGGTILLDGQPVGPEVRRKMQVVFQDPYGSFNPRHKVARLVSEPFHLLGRKATEAEIDEALISVGLTPADKTKYIHEFSGGQRQRIAIARALIIKPELIVLDEAVSALDVSIRAQILDLLADLSDRFGLTYLFISHDLSVVRAITDRCLVMQSGKIVEEGDTEHLFTAPSHPYTQTLIAAAPTLPDL
ncbi:peptide/nickel transport system ATP-binding protein [Litoreibacter ascidiaceicola]|uniref:Peptide/nickel transport system ATP-binding protein n=1 Tax=Litoreibacter ascidiaceicola TaxID=1486859 RepID=A0A1M5C9P7_9RHOB|nr:dipeptide ABC transporter ATP-binding protein [Litoreibacter ascidiaceicola]SHF51400.1 peptide/nickel transport system ATP-binding protein [Litoreibacter ascidiaceicola]